MQDNIGTNYQSEISRFVDWCENNKLMINTKKTDEIVFDPKSISDHRQLLIHDQLITHTQTCKYLGIYIYSSLTWKTH